MMPVWEITSIKALRLWLRDHASPERIWYARSAPGRTKCLLLSEEPSIVVQWDSCNREELPLYPIDLPSAEEARAWWFGLWDDEIVEYRYATGLEIACVAKTGTWRSLSPWGFLRHKGDFRIVQEEQFRQIVGERRFGKMLDEHGFVGISVRWLRSLDRDC